jgi:hypothetical protein
MLEGAFRDFPVSEIANDWGAAELACGDAARAERFV